MLITAWLKARPDLESGSRVRAATAVPLVFIAMGKTKVVAKKINASRASASEDVPVIPSAGDLRGATVGRSSADQEAYAEGENTLHAYVMDFCTDGALYGDQFEGEMSAVHLFYKHGSACNTAKTVLLYSFVCGMVAELNVYIRVDKQHS